MKEEERRLPAQRQAFDVLHSLIAHGTNEQVKPVKRKEKKAAEMDREYFINGQPLKGDEWCFIHKTAILTQ